VEPNSTYLSNINTSMWSLCLVLSPAIPPEEPECDDMLHRRLVAPTRSAPENKDPASQYSKASVRRTQGRTPSVEEFQFHE
jgi:hypothetical protein